MTAMKLVSWNVNGLRAATRKGFAEWLHRSEAQIVGVQEIRAEPHQLPEKTRAPSGWSTHFFPASRKPGYSGVGLFSRSAPNSIRTSLGEARFDVEGRVQIARFGDLTVVNTYFPNGSGTNRDLSRVPYKLDFYDRLRGSLQSQLDAGAPMVVMGDFNTAHREIDLARPRSNRKTSGFRPEERKRLQRWFDAGWVDSFRHFYPDATDHYTWWTYRGDCRARNVGWRIDYILVSPGALPHLQAAHIHPDVMGSDHCPISIHLDESVLGDVG